MRHELSTNASIARLAQLEVNWEVEVVCICHMDGCKCPPRKTLDNQNRWFAKGQAVHKKIRLYVKYSTVWLFDASKMDPRIHVP